MKIIKPKYDLFHKILWYIENMESGPIRTFWCIVTPMAVLFVTFFIIIGIQTMRGMSVGDYIMGSIFLFCFAFVPIFLRWIVAYGFFTNLDQIDDNLHHKIGSLILGKDEPCPQNESSTLFKGKYKKVYIMLPETEKDKALLRKERISWWYPSKQSLENFKNSSELGQKLTLIMWEKMGYFHYNGHSNKFSTSLPVINKSVRL